MVMIVLITNDIKLLFKFFDNNLLFYITTKREIYAKNILINSCFINKNKFFDECFIIIVQIFQNKSLQPTIINNWPRPGNAKWSS